LAREKLDDARYVLRSGEALLSARILDLEHTGARDEQAREVAAKFLCEARSHLRNGKVDLAKRKVAAADNVLSGGVDAPDA
jgi:hypothetical protein